MDRRRIEYPGAFYHAVQRGKNKENIFPSDADKQRYLSNLFGVRKAYDFPLPTVPSLSQNSIMATCMDK